MAFCPLITIPLCNSQPSVRRSFVQIAGRTKLSVGMCETREYRKIAASSDWKKMRAPAKKKFPMLPFAKRNLSLECLRICISHQKSPFGNISTV
jgi:hypothetical protein